MQITYRIIIDSEYCRAIIQRYYRQKPFFLRLETQFALTLIPFTLWWLIQWRADASAVQMNAIVNSLLLWLIGIVVGLFLTKWIILRRIKAKIEFGTKMTVMLSETGIDARGGLISGQWSWAAYPKSTRFPDGILLQRAGVIRWLPDSSIQKGTPEQASQLVASKTQLRCVG